MVGGELAVQSLASQEGALGELVPGSLRWRLLELMVLLLEDLEGVQLLLVALVSVAMLMSPFLGHSVSG